MNYIIELDQFEGPLDLLLHLIKESNIDIFDINLEDITNQYLNYIHKIDEMNLNIASEYLVMAAELIEMKSRNLLPKKEELGEDEYEEDPREELIRRLIEYKNYKEITPALHDMELNRNQYFTKIPSLEVTGIDMSTQLSEDINMDKLMDAFNNFLKRKELSKPLNTKITTKEYSVSKRSYEIREILKHKDKVKFDELFDFYSKDYLVVTFLSILNMAKNKELYIEQTNNFDELFISARK